MPKAELGKLMPPSCIHDSLDLGVVERAMELQKELAHKERSLCLMARRCALGRECSGAASRCSDLMRSTRIRGGAWSDH